MYAQQERNQFLLFEKFLIQQACLDNQTQYDFCFLDWRYPNADIELEEDLPMSNHTVNYGYGQICIIMNIWRCKIKPLGNLTIKKHTTNQVKLNKIILL